MSVPSFSSFPDPEQTEGSPPRTKTSIHSSRRKHESSRHARGDKKSREREEDHCLERRQSRSRSHSPKHHVRLHGRSHPGRASEARLSPPQSTSAPPFFLDKKGDPLNLKYGGMHAGSIPIHRLLAHGRRILGLQPTFRVFRRSSKGLDIGLPGGHSKGPALTDASSRDRLGSRPILLSSARSLHKYEEVGGFLRLSSSCSRPREQEYRSITRQDRGVQSDTEASNSGESSKSGSSEFDSDYTPFSALQLTLKHLEQEILANPTSVSAWLTIVSHSISSIPPNSVNASKVIAEISTAIIQRALDAHSSNRNSFILRVKYLFYGEEIWTTAELQNAWEDALKSVDESAIWFEWLVWRTRMAVRGVGGLIEDAERVINATRSVDNDALHLKVLHLIAINLRSSGFVERATALWQAEAELLFACPHRLQAATMSEKLAALEEYWDTELPRLGEDGAKGWTRWDTELQRSSNRNSQSSASTTLSPATQDPFHDWANGELQADGTLVWPARDFGDNSTQGLDPYAAVLFSDIRSLLVPIQSPEGKHRFRLAWLSFVGLHIPGLHDSAACTRSWDDRWFLMRYSNPAFLAMALPHFSDDTRQYRIVSDSISGALVGRERAYNSGFGPVKSWSNGVLHPLDDIGGNSLRMWSSLDVDGVDQMYARRIFVCCRQGFDEVEWDAYQLALEAAIDIRSAVQLSRTQLSASKESLHRWRSHALLEIRRHRLDEARHIFQTVVSSFNFDPANPGAGEILWSWTRMEILAGRPDRANAVLLLAAGIKSPSADGVTLLRAKRTLEERAIQVPLGVWQSRISWILLRGLLELLVNTHTSALAYFDTHTGKGDFEIGSIAHEALSVAVLDMLYIHTVVLRNHMPPAILRECVQRALDVFPENTIILGLFLEGEKGEGVWGRVRACLAESSVAPKSISRRVFEVWLSGWEKGRWESQKQRTRSGFTAAMQSERTRFSAILWRLYLEFEIRTGELERAKSLLIRAIQQFPLVKDFYLLAFLALRSVFNDRELIGLAETMAERGIRMRVGLDESLEGQEGPTVASNEVDSSSDSSGLADEVIQDASEYRRLLPF